MVLAKHPFVPERLRAQIVARPGLQRVMWRIEALVVGAVWALVGALPVDRAYRFGRALGRILGPKLRKTEQVRANLTNALPDRTPAEIEALVREVWGGHFGAAAEFPHFGRIAAAGEERIAFEVRGDVRGLREPGRPMILVTAHTGNWQLATTVMARLGRRLTSVYAPESNPFVDAFINRCREGLHCDLVPRDGSVKALMRVLAAGGSIGIVGDNRVNEGESILLFGKPTQISQVPAKLALRFDAELVPAWVERLEDSHFRVTVFDPIRPEPHATPREQARQMTRRLVDHFETWFRARPEQWICTRRYWPKPENVAKLPPVPDLAPRAPARLPTGKHQPRSPAQAEPRSGEARSEPQASEVLYGRSAR